MVFLWFIIVGGIAGWLAGLLWKGHGFGLFGNIVVGIVGAVIGGWLFGLIGVGVKNTLGEIVVSVIGALVLLFVVGVFRKGASPE